MIHVTSPENSRNIKYSINNMGILTVYSVNPKSDSSKEMLMEGDKFSAAIISTEYKPKDYQSMLASLFIESDNKIQNVINVNYVNPPKTLQKPNKFEVESKRLLTFN
jgi:hypothetical protein